MHQFYSFTTILIVAIIVFLFSQAVVVVTAATAAKEEEEYTKKKYCIIGAGAAGTQLAYFMKQANMDVIVFEKSSHAGSFFSKYPKQRKLISINKVFTGTNDLEFNLRHDWNSLLSNDHDEDDYFGFKKLSSSSSSTKQKTKPPLLFKNFSKEYYPDAGILPKYLDAFIDYNNLREFIKFNAKVEGILHLEKRTRTTKSKNNTKKKTKTEKNKKQFLVIVSDSNSNNNNNKKSGKNKNSNKNKNKKQQQEKYVCDAVILASGKSLERIPKLKEGSHLITTYTDAPTNAEAYANQRILIFGGGNSAFELARSIQDYTALVHIATRNNIQLAHQTHYVGDVRGINLAFLDHYQLKSNDALIGTTSDCISKEQLYFNNETKRIYFSDASWVVDEEKMQQEENQRIEQEQDEELNRFGFLDERAKKYIKQKAKTNRQQEQEQRQEQQQETTSLLSKEEEKEIQNLEIAAHKEIHPSRMGYDRVISCLGFKADFSFFSTSPSSSSCSPIVKQLLFDKNNNRRRRSKTTVRTKNKKDENNDDDDDDDDEEEIEEEEFLSPISPQIDSSKSFLEISSNFESVNVENLFVAGALAHFRDFKRSAGGFIHGFRYTARTLVAMLRERFEGENNNNNNNRYPSLKMNSRQQVFNRLMYRLANVSSLYQMQSQLCDVVLIHDDENENESDNNKNQQQQKEAGEEISSSSSSSSFNYEYIQDLPLDMIKSKVPQFVSIKAFKDFLSNKRRKKSKFRFISFSLEFGKDFQGVGTLHHQAQKETYARRAAKMLWDGNSKNPLTDPDYRLAYSRTIINNNNNENENENENNGDDDKENKKLLVLDPLYRPTAADLLERDKNFAKKYEDATFDVYNTLHPLGDPPSMQRGTRDKPPRLNKFLFLHPVIREYEAKIQRTSGGGSSSRNNNNRKQETSSSSSSIETVKYQLIRELRLHEDVLNQFTGKIHTQTPVRKFLEKVLKK